MGIAGKRDDHFRGPMNRGMRIDGFRAAQGNWTMIHVGGITKREVTPREPNYHQEGRHENRHDTLICENVAPFVERNTNPVPLAANGDFKIDDVLSPPPPPSSCATPVLLIRNAGNGNWFAAGIQKFNGGHLAE